ncbi:hypothetical protein K8090_16870 [Halomonas meridiana]|uniref:hypothetical protein n=1 Tax=Vreelandella aquamarina TaxID=77097 RepID=UPI001E2E9A6D|nr:MULTISPECIES: hypothetical protein [Halomonas]MCD1653034.1 hypothetical protein [Halomonas axialensis]MCD2089386.1 hypothetical protein [Halomonas meridiana]
MISSVTIVALLATDMQAAVQARLTQSTGRRLGGVQVLFEAPSPALNDRLGVTLSSLGAVYEQRSKTFAVTGDSSRTSIVIENAVGAGQLPPLTESQASQPQSKG